MESCTPRKAPWWVTIVSMGLIAALTGMTIVGRLSDPSHRKFLVLDVAVGIVSVVLLPIMFRRPVPGAIALAVLAALSPAGTPASTVGTLTVSLRRPLRTAALVALAGTVGHLIQGLWQPIHGLPYLWFAVLDVAVHAALLG